MDIIIKKVKTVRAEEIRAGRFFIWGEDVFMRVNNNGKATSLAMMNHTCFIAVNVFTNDLTEFPHNVDVTPMEQVTPIELVPMRDAKEIDTRISSGGK